MKSTKSQFLPLLEVLSFFWRIFPKRLRVQFFFLMFVLDSRGGEVRSSLRSLFLIEEKLNLVINERALRLGNGEHPKHQLIPYHNFFIRNLEGASRVLDVGCGYGAVARSIARALPRTEVTGIENDLGRYLQAKDHVDNPPNVKFIFSDLYDYSPESKFDCIVLSNVLEHLENRTAILVDLKRISGASTFLIRVPAFERHWTIPLRRDLGMNYFTDDDHKIEHTLEEFYSEVSAAGLKVLHLETLWGEIWAICQ
jgi:SAM-dependent methyltransferase